MASPAGRRACAPGSAARNHAGGATPAAAAAGATPAAAAAGATAAAAAAAADSPGHLLAVGVHGAAGPDRAVPAPRVNPCLEQRAGHARRHGLDQVLRPVRFRV